MGGFDGIKPVNSPHVEKVAAISASLQKLLDDSLEKFEKTSALRREFFEKLVILDGGTVALSVTLLGNLESRHIVLLLIWMLGASWILLLASMASAMCRSWFTQEHERQSTSRWLVENVMAHEASLVDLATQVQVPLEDVAKGNAIGAKLTENLEATENRLNAIIVWCERSCIVFTVLGFAALIAFAIGNLAALRVDAQTPNQSPAMVSQVEPLSSKAASCGLRAELRRRSVNALYNPNSISLDYLVTNNSERDYTFPDTFRVLAKSPDGVLHADAELGLPPQRFFPRGHAVEFSVDVYLGNLVAHSPTEADKAELQKQLDGTQSYILFDKTNHCEVELPAHP